MATPQMSATLSLPGPSTLTYEYLLDLVSAVTVRSFHSYAPAMPRRVAMAVAKVAQSVWWPIMSPDEVTRRYVDDSSVPGDWEKLGITPMEIEPLALKYLRRYRSTDNYSDPVAFPARPEYF
jgi:NADH dehydrogenase (ubiquinone) 1 alpha subcomplex subunit 9